MEKPACPIQSWPIDAIISDVTMYASQLTPLSYQKRRYKTSVITSLTQLFTRLSINEVCGLLTRSTIINT